MEEENTIELIDLLRVVWKWKWFIIVFTFVCAIAAGIISFSMPKIYDVSMIVESGTIGTGKSGELIYLETSDHIKSEIEANAYNSRIIDALKLDGEKKIIINFKVFSPIKSRMIKVTTEYESTERDIGIKVMKQLFEELFKQYREIIEMKRRLFDNQILLENKEIDKMEIRIRALRKNIKINEVKEKFLVEELEKVRANTEIILTKRDALLSKKTDNNGISALLYSNIIQQNMMYNNQLDNQLYLIITKQGDLKRDIEDLGNEKKAYKANIDNIKLQRGFVSNIKYIQEPQVSDHPIKPKKKLNVVLAFVIGLFVSIFLAFFLEYIKKMKDYSKSIPTTDQRSSIENQEK